MLLRLINRNPLSNWQVVEQEGQTLGLPDMGPLPLGPQPSHRVTRGSASQETLHFCPTCHSSRKIFSVPFAVIDIQSRKQQNDTFVPQPPSMWPVFVNSRQKPPAAWTTSSRPTTSMPCLVQPSQEDKPLLKCFTACFKNQTFYEDLSKVGRHSSHVSWVHSM